MSTYGQDNTVDPQFIFDEQTSPEKIKNLKKLNKTKNDDPLIVQSRGAWAGKSQPYIYKKDDVINATGPTLFYCGILSMAVFCMGFHYMHQMAVILQPQFMIGIFKFQIIKGFIHFLPLHIKSRKNNQF